jgi:hypothetical protein
MIRTTQPLRLRSGELSPGTGVRTGTSVADLRQLFLDNLFCSLGRVPMAATPNDIYTALALTVRDRVHEQGVRTMEARSEQEARVVAYLSAEFLPGPHLANNLLNLGIVELARQALAEFGLDLDEVIEQEEEPGLGNGGLGRLASCLLEGPCNRCGKRRSSGRKGDKRIIAAEWIAVCASAVALPHAATIWSIYVRSKPDAPAIRP